VEDHQRLALPTFERPILFFEDDAMSYPKDRPKCSEDLLRYDSAAAVNQVATAGVNDQGIVCITLPLGSKNSTTLGEEIFWGKMTKQR